MKTQNSSTSTMCKSIVRILLITAGILLIPLIAMQFTEEVDWGVFDFIIIGSLLVTTGLIYEFAIRKVNSAMYRGVLAVILLATLLLIWAELAVGVFGTPFAGE